MVFIGARDNFGYQELVESCWIEVDTGIRQKKPIVIGCIYRHPKSNFEQFAENLDEILRNLNQDKRIVYILGDTNIDFYKFPTHNPTENFLDMLFSNMTPVITKPTRITEHSKTLIDHIYTNAPTMHLSSGIALFDISDHLPVFCLSNTKVKTNHQKQSYRDCIPYHYTNHGITINAPVLRTVPLYTEVFSLHL